MRIRRGMTAAAAALAGVAALGTLPGAAAGAPVARVAPVSVATPRWQWPVVPPRIVNPYAAPSSPYAAGHRGIDLAAEPGTVVVAPADAVVHFAGVVVDRPVLTLDHGSGVLSSYEPLIAQATEAGGAGTDGAAGAGAGLREGDPVARGSVLGVVGSGAHCSGVCLHVGVRVDGAYVSPLLFFDSVPHSVLLPLGSGAGGGAQARG